jgi:hypothetical protein
VNSFMPGRSGRLVVSEGFVRGLGLFRGALVWCRLVFKSVGPLILGIAD